MERTLALTGLALTLLGALVLAWRDLAAKRMSSDSPSSEPLERQLFAWIGFPLIAVGSILQIAGFAVGGDNPSAPRSATRLSQCIVRVSFLPGSTAADMAAARDAAGKNRDVQSVRFVSSSEALAEMKKRYPDLVKNLPSNPLGDSLRITLLPGASSTPVLRDIDHALGLPRGKQLARATCT